MFTSKNQSGFSALEAILILVVVGIIGGTGFFVWHSKQAADKDASVMSTTSMAQNRSSSTKTRQYTIAEWGIKISTPKGLPADDIYFTYLPGTDDKMEELLVSSKKIDASKNTCNPNIIPSQGIKQPFLVVVRDKNNTTWNIMYGGKSTDAVKVGDWYYLVTAVNTADCYAKDTINGYLVPAVSASVRDSIVAE